MAFFAVTKETIESINPIPGADAIQVAKLKGMDFQMVVKKDFFQVGEEVLYFPIDCLVPLPLQEKLGVVNRLSGNQKNRIKTVTLRGQISQGILGKLDIVDHSLLTLSPEEMTEKIGITKYEPPVIPCKTANLHTLPLGLSKYDIEGADRYTDYLEMMMDIPVVITEKLEGSNFSVSYDPVNNMFYVNQRNHTVVPKQEYVHDYWKVAERDGWLKVVKDISEQTSKVVTLYGEFIGPGYQGNIYNLQDHEARYFDMKIGDEWIADNDSSVLLKKHNAMFKDVPLIHCGNLREWLGGKSVKEASNGKSLLNPNILREGIVIKPFEKEMQIHKFGRLILKQRSPQYLAKSEF